MFCGFALLGRLLQLQRADADEIAGRPDQRGAAPVRMRRRGEDRFVEHIFPVAGEFLLGDDTGGDRALPSAGAADHDAFADRGGCELADFERRHFELGQRLNQAEAGLLVVAEHMARHRAAVIERDPDRVRFGNQVADGENESVAADEHAVAGALGAERLGSEGVLRHDGAQRRPLTTVHDRDRKRSPQTSAVRRSAPSSRSPMASDIPSLQPSICDLAGTRSSPFARLPTARLPTARLPTATLPPVKATDASQQRTAGQPPEMPAFKNSFDHFA